VQQQSDRFQAEPTDANLESVLSMTATRVESKRLKASQLSGGSGVPMDPNARINAIEEFNFYRNVWKNRKGTCIEFLGNFDSAKKMKDLMDDVGIETDEAENVVLPALLPVPSRIQVARH
jgi:ribosomal protein L12E/L44/L45/RPP1/RPP2